MTALEPRISVVTLAVDDMHRARAFYERLGWSAAASSSADVTFFNMGGVVLGLYGRNALADDARVAVSAGPSTNASLAHNCESEDRVDAVMAFAQAAGAKIVKPAERRSGAAIPGIFQTLTGICGKVPTTLSFQWIKTDGLPLHEPR